jgi:hypothetical protein
MVLTAEQDAKFKKLCGDIKPGEFGRVEVSFIGSPTNTVQIKAEKTVRFHNEKAIPTVDEPIDGSKSGRINRQNS